MELSMMLTIVDEDGTDKIIKFFRDSQVRYQYISPAFGTANSELLELLGLGETSKSVIISLIEKQQARSLSLEMPERIRLGKSTKGLVVTLPLTGVSNSLFESLKLPSERMLQMEQEPVTPTQADDVVRHDLIVALVNRDASEEVMEVAKAAGAQGGTVINARRVGLDEDNTFMGIPIQAGKEILMILTDRKKKLHIMKAVNHDFGLNTPTHGLIFSIPVDSVAWLE